jgi:hypothetical protein
MRKRNSPGLTVRRDTFLSRDEEAALRVPVRRARVRRGMRGAAERLELVRDSSAYSTVTTCPGMVFDFETTGHEMRAHSCFLCSSHARSLEDDADERVLRDLVAWAE